MIRQTIRPEQGGPVGGIRESLRELTSIELQFHRGAHGRETASTSVQRLLAIDVGNTHIKLGLAEDGQWRWEWRLSTDVRRTADEYHLSVYGFLTGVGVEKVDQAVVASVVPLLTPAFLRVAETLSRVPPIEVQPPGYGLTVDYPPESLGPDRFVNALAAWRKICRPVVVVDVGTTATVDAVTQDADLTGRFIGGSIAPGPHFLTAALAQGTARLPHIPPVIPDVLIGQNTADAIAVGVGYGFIGMVKELIRRTWLALGEEAPVVLTGGWSRRIQPYLTIPVYWEPRLTLEGLRLAADWVADHGAP